MVIDLTMIFLIREVIIGVFLHKLEESYLLSMGDILLVLMVMRTLAIRFSPDKI